MSNTEQQPKPGIWINAAGLGEHVRGWTARDVESFVRFLTKHRHPEILPEMFPQFVSSGVPQEATSRVTRRRSASKIKKQKEAA